MKQPIGRIVVTREFLRDHDLVMEVMKGIHVINTEYDFFKDQCVMMAYCSDFKMVDTACIPPLYKLYITEVMDGDAIRRLVKTEEVRK